MIRTFDLLPRLKRRAALLAACWLAACLLSATVHAAPTASSSPEEITPLLIGRSVPEATVRTMEGRELDLRKALGDEPAVLVFYRGGW